MTAEHVREQLERMLSVFTDVNASGEQIGRFFTDDVVQKVDGRTYDRAAFLDHFQALNSSLASSRVAIDHFVSDGNSAATVHTADLVKKSGEAVRLKVVAFYAFRDGRIALVDELTHLVSGAEEDRHLGSVRT